MDAAIEDRLARIRGWVQRESQDKLAYFRFAVPRLREGFRLFTGLEPIDELHCRGPNLTGKTLTKTAFIVGCLQKRKDLDGVPIPQWKGRVKGLQLVLDYPQQLLSVRPAYEQLLEGWPHKVKLNGEYLSSIRVMPVGGNPDDERDWSVIYFGTQKNKDTGRGARADIIDFDEPPTMFFLQELRKAGHIGRRSIIVIGETPERLKEWAPIRKDYGDTPRRSIRRVDAYRAEVRWSLDEVEPWLLSDEDKAKMRAKYANDPIRDAREHGDYTNAEGSSPWGELRMLTLLEMLEGSHDGDPVELRIPMEGEDGSPAIVSRETVRCFKAADPTKRYYLDVDPASGVDDGKHHEAALHCSEIGTGDLCVSWAGYLSPYQLGVLAATVGRQYNNAAVDIEMKDHWGVNVVRGCEASRYGNLAYEERELRTGVWSKEVGFDMNDEVKAIIVGCIQDWLDAWRAGVKYAHCPSRSILEDLINCELDERGKIVAGPGLAHGHGMILWGQKLRRAVSRTNRPIPEIQQPQQTHDEFLAKMIQRTATVGPVRVMPTPRQRPRI